MRSHQLKKYKRLMKKSKKAPFSKAFTPKMTTKSLQKYLPVSRYLRIRSIPLE